MGPFRREGLGPEVDHHQLQNLKDLPELLPVPVGVAMRVHAARAVEPTSHVGGVDHGCKAASPT
eukprot:4827645-Alexandrium_andersonii.AAC.1